MKPVPKLSASILPAVLEIKIDRSYLETTTTSVPGRPGWTPRMETKLEANRSLPGISSLPGWHEPKINTFTKGHNGMLDEE